MAGSVNKVILVGNLGREPEARAMQNGGKVVTFSLATNESWRDKATNERRDKTEWHRCVMFGKSAELAGELLKKGQLLYTEGKLQTRNWEDKDGIKRYTTEVVCEMFTMLGRKMDADNNQSAGSYNESEKSADSKSDDEDLPF